MKKELTQQQEISSLKVEIKQLHEIRDRMKKEAEQSDNPRGRQRLSDALERSDSRMVPCSMTDQPFEVVDPEQRATLPCEQCRAREGRD